MFLRKTSRFKDGKRHDYWSVAENARAGARVVQRQLLYLGEIDEDRQNAWLNAIDELEERKAEDAASYLIPPQPEQKRETSATVRIRLNKMTVIWISTSSFTFSIMSAISAALKSSSTSRALKYCFLSR